MVIPGVVLGFIVEDDVVICSVGAIVTAFAEIDDVLTERLKVELATASVKVATAELIFGNVLTSLNISTASTTMDP